MSKRYRRIVNGPMTVLAFCVVLMAGCDTYLPGPSYTDVEIPSEKLRQIETLELAEAEPNDGLATEPNEAPPAELELSLEECRALALQNNLELKASLIDPTIAAEQLSEEEAKFEASFFANTTFNKVNQPVDSNLSIAGSNRNVWNSDLGVRVPLRTGGTVNFTLADARTKSDSTFSRFNPSYSPSTSVSVSQPLLQGAGRWANMHSIRIASYNRQITDARTKLEIINVLAAIDRVYWRLYAARKQLEVRTQQYELAQMQLEQAGRFVNAGERAQVEIIRAEAGVAQQLEAIIVAENSLRDRERELKRVMNRAGVGMQTPTVLIPNTEPDPIRYELERAKLVGTAQDSRMELLELQLQLLEDASGIDYARNQALPLASLDYTYSINGLGGTRTDAYDLLIDNEFASHRLGLQVVIPLGNKAAESRIRQALYRRRQRLASRTNRETLIEQEVLNAADSVETNWQRILAARQNTILQGRLYEAERRQFELGARTSTDVLDAQTNFADAQSAEINALAEYQISLVDLAYATGTILGADRIQWEPVVPPTR
jgi:outer membrane protein TolC